MEGTELESLLEGILFASGEAVPLQRICQVLQLDPAAVRQGLESLQKQYLQEKRGIRLLELEDRWQLCSAPEHAEVIRQVCELRKPAKLSQPALEVLTIIAYQQPTTRAVVDQIRGVDSANTLGLLLRRNLIEECGRLQAPGRPHLYRTTQQFLRAFQLRSLEDLPPLPEQGSHPEDDDT